ncbi:transposase protein [Holotrichia oblita]|uniref:Transposase protein n=1 Tax=Holotrichia oblita TaxID=644536 RepID=A0ACB9TDZ8_HOLOL|nr:transposase protein [Holotrichia oblita]
MFLSTVIAEEDNTALPVASTASTQTPKASSSNTPRKQRFREKLKEIRRQNLKIRKLFKCPQEKETLSNFDKYCDKYLPQVTAKFVKIQARLNQVKTKGRRYSTEYKQFALTLYFLGPRAYGFLQKLFCLPAKRSLERITANLSYGPGLNNDALYTALKIKVDLMTEIEKNCILRIDEMAVKQKFFYHIGRDEIVGLKDIGVGEKEFAAARNVTVIMARGLHHNWVTVGLLFC